MERGQEIGLEIAGKRAFAWAVDWPGWCRSGKTEHDAIDALLACSKRYANVLKGSRIPFLLPVGDISVVERTKGNATTEFGAPAIPADVDFADLTDVEAKTQARILWSCWTHLDRIAESSSEMLQKGPRGGGRDRDEVLQHVLNAEAAYARKLGLKVKAAGFDDLDQICQNREVIAQFVEGNDAGESIAWPIRYGVRRIAWHVLDHAWEIEDKSQ